MILKSLLSRTLSVLGSILIICSLLSLFSIGYKSKNLVLFGAATGAIAWVLAWLLSKNKAPSWVGLAFPLFTSTVYAQRALANFWSLIGIVQQQAVNYDAKNKCTLIILLLIMTASSITALMMAYVFQTADTKNTTQ